MYSANQGPNELKRTINDQSTGNNINHRTKPLLSSRELANLPALRQTDLAQESEMRCHTCHSNGACVGSRAFGSEDKRGSAVLDRPPYRIPGLEEVFDEGFRCCWSWILVVNDCMRYDNIDMQCYSTRPLNVSVR